MEKTIPLKIILETTKRINFICPFILINVEAKNGDKKPDFYYIDSCIIGHER